MGAETKANEGIQQAGMAMQQGGGGDGQATQALESAALDIRNHSYDRSDNQTNPDTSETIPLRTAQQVHAAYLNEVRTSVVEGMEAMQSFDQESFEAGGTSLPEAVETINGYCASYAQQQKQAKGK